MLIIIMLYNLWYFTRCKILLFFLLLFIAILDFLD